MTWIQTYSGIAFDLLDPAPDMVSLEDIAHHLSLINRYTGAVRWPYSVAQHSVIMSEQVAPEHALWALLHDAPEAYVGDVSRPLKHCPGMEGYAVIDARVERAVAGALGLRPAAETIAAIKEADVRMLATEARQLLTWPPPRPWSHDAEPYEIELEPWTPEFAEGAFLDRYHLCAGDLLGYLLGSLPPTRWSGSK